MHYPNRRNAMIIRIVVVTISLGFLTLSSALGQAAPTVVADGFFSPQGVLVDSDGSVYVVESGHGGDTQVNLASPFSGEMTSYAYGESARIVRVTADGKTSEIARLPSLFVSAMESVGGARLARLDGVLYATVGGYGADPDSLPHFAAVVRVDGGTFEEVAGLVEYENAHDPDGVALESNPYALAAGPDGHLWATDAAGNDLLRIDPSTGEIELVAVFDGVPSPIPNAHRGGEMMTDPVPTGIAFGKDGEVYVSCLTGIPFVPGSAKVVMVSSDGEVSDFATGLTMLTDVRRGPDGNLYAVSFGRFTEEGPVPNSGALLRIRAGDESEELVTGLAFPTSLGFSRDGNAYVTVMNSLAEGGTGELLRLEGVASPSAQTN